NPGKLNYGAGIITTRLAGYLFNREAGLDVQYIPFNGSAPTVQGLLTGTVDYIIDGAATSLPLIQSGKLRALAKLNSRPLPALPQIRPLAVEAGIPALDDISTWIGLVAPAGTPRSIVDKIQREVVKMYADPVIAEKLEKSGISAVSSTPEEFDAFVRKELDRWDRVFKDSGIKLNCSLRRFPPPFPFHQTNDPVARGSNHGAAMSKPKILIFAPREEPPETVNALEGLGCELVFGDRDWQLPRTTHEEAVVEAARDAVALMGTSMRHTPISRRIMQASQRLRIVAKYTVGVDDVDTDAATELGIMVCHAPTESNCFGVAETTITFMLSLLKKVAERDADVRAGKWRTADNFAYYVGSRASDGFPGQTIGLVGLG